MEQQTRVKKYAQLREMIAEDHEETNFHDALAPFAKRLSAVDDRFTVDPERAAYKDYVPEHAKVKAYQQLFENDSEDLITNDFLEQFIEEVKSYNVKEGTRAAQETTENVMHAYTQLQAQQASNLNQDNQELLRPRGLEALTQEEISLPDYSQESIENEDDLIDDVLDRIEKDVQLTSSSNSLEDKAWFTQTQELSKAVESMETSISSVNEKILATNRLVNFLLAIFILGLIIVSAYLVYTILGIQVLL
jgi:hypothetical protein